MRICWKGEKKNVRGLYLRVSVLSELKLEKMYKLFPGIRQTILIKRLSVKRGSTVQRLQMDCRSQYAKSE